MNGWNGSDIHCIILLCKQISDSITIVMALSWSRACACVRESVLIRRSPVHVCFYNGNPREIKIKSSLQVHACTSRCKLCTGHVYTLYGSRVHFVQVTCTSSKPLPLIAALIELLKGKLLEPPNPSMPKLCVTRKITRTLASALRDWKW